MSDWLLSPADTIRVGDAIKDNLGASMIFRVVEAAVSLGIVVPKEQFDEAKRETRNITRAVARAIKS